MSFAVSTGIQLEVEALKRITGINQIITEIQNKVPTLLGAAALIVYLVDELNDEVYSPLAAGDVRFEALRERIFPNSIIGYTAYKQKTVNINNVHCAKELAELDKGLVFEDKFCKIYDLSTKQILAVPFFHDDILMGIIQVLNKTEEQPFDEQDIALVQNIGEVLGKIVFEKGNSVTSARNRFYHLIKNGLISRRDMQVTLLEAKQSNIRPESLLMRNYRISKEQIGLALASYYHCDFVPFDGEALNVDEKFPLDGFRKEYFLNELWFPLGKKNGDFCVTMEDPGDITKCNSIKQVLGTKDLKFFVSLKEDIENFIERAFDGGKNSYSSISEILLSSVETASRMVDNIEASKNEADGVVVRIVNKIIFDACQMRASDIHIEPDIEDKNIGIRFRIDGDCKFYQILPFSYHRSIVSRIKIMSNLDTTNRRFPQDGKIKFKIPGDKPVDLRVATLPVQNGAEDVVMRILRKDETVLPIKCLQLSERDEREFLKMLERPHGLILAVGPTGSGKTTTLHSALRHVNKPGKKIWTAEDPVEITQHGLRQVQINPMIGFDFSMAMRAFLRADPDIIMVGEMRDYETAKIGIEASLTGHLVFSTLHTNSAVETVIRLLDIGIDRINFADSLIGILSQRLVKKLCTECREPYQPTEAQQAILEAYYHDRKIDVPKNLLFYRGKGCRHCEKAGYLGRIGVFELLVASSKIKSLVKAGLGITELLEVARQEGMTSLFEDGIRKSQQALVNFDDIYRVCL